MNGGSVSRCDGISNARGARTHRDVVFEVLLLDRRHAHGDDGRFTQGDMSLRVHEHDSERRRYDGGSTSMKRRGGYVFEFSVSHCDLA
jgi:hypothetical protein